MKPATPPFHGGRLQAATKQFNIPLSDWLDLSTGINPYSWQVPAIPQDIWQRLPDSYAPLEAAAETFYGAAVVAIPGSQWAIQNLPAMIQCRRVWIPAEAYEEHKYWWQWHNHQTLAYASLEQITLQPQDSVVVINPNNPTAKHVATAQLLDLARKLNREQGYLILDEAFMDPTPERSVLGQAEPLPTNLIVLRSLGKFFGLAGLRLGFIYCQGALLSAVREKLGPWAVSHPAAYVGELALQDQSWHQSTRALLQQSAHELHQLLSANIPAQSITTTGLFSSIQLNAEVAEALFSHCAQQGILLRHFPQWQKIRVGLTTKSGMERLLSALRCWNI